MAAPGLSIPIVQKRVPALDGVRGVAILLVLVWHCLLSYVPRNSPHLLGIWRLGTLAWSGVDLFFTLSGYLIIGILLDARDSPRYYQTFYRRRALRILPLYVFLLSLAGCAYLFHVRWAVDDRSVPLAGYFFFVQNFFMATAASFGLAILAPTWSLAVEEQFYALAPLAVRALSPKALTRACLSVIVASPLVRAVIPPSHWLAVYVLLPTHCEALAYGALAALMIRNPAAWKRVLAVRPLVAALFGSLVLVSLWLARVTDSRTVINSSTYPVVATMYFCLLLLVLSRSGSLTARLMSNQFLRFSGVRAYGLYLLHMPALVVYRYFLHGYDWGTRGLALRLVFLAGVFATAELSWRYLEEPCISRGHRLRY